MPKVRILIVEDDHDQAEELHEQLAGHGYEVSGIAHNLKDAYGLFYAQSPDIIVVDIFLNGKPEGITFVETMNKNATTRRPFIYLTSHSDVHTFGMAKATVPYSYLLKPFNPIELQYAIDLALDKFAEEDIQIRSESRNVTLVKKDFYIKLERTLIKVPMNDILYVEVAGKFSNIVTEEGSYLTQLALKNMMELLDETQFYRVHRNFIVNRLSIDRIELTDQEIILDNGKIIPFSKNFKSKGLTQLEILK